MSSDSKPLMIGQLLPGMKNVNLTFLVLDIGQARRTQQGHEIRSVRVADQSGSILMCVWDALVSVITDGEIWRLRNGYTNVFKGTLGLACSKAGDFMKVGEFFMLYSELPNMSEYNSELAAKYPMVKKGSPGDENRGGAGAEHSAAGSMQQAAGGKLGGGDQGQGNTATGSNHGSRMNHDIKQETLDNIVMRKPPAGRSRMWQ